ncbi:hypothetical protein SAMN05660690_1619 [Geodermatophilus telluris]|uniref:SipW-cognate class signal peptide n=1 Tax=Geodermatophilus telluris TaxID=1190417 RepID=A0A1G6M0X2_9ACTN|nr:hypothetical protein [Geodermatophilus telluris]SDC48606.1 hypothetical protein SAMN05660690_1619 [Geodermatophilus telluris]
MRVSLRRGRRSVLAGAVPVGLVLSMALTWSSTHAAFSASTNNPGNSWQTGSVVLADNDSNTALFQSTVEVGLVPGAAKSRCIRLDYTGDVTADIRMYVGLPTGGVTTLDTFLVMSVERGQNVSASTAVAPDCSTGFTQNATRTFLFNTAQANDPAADQAATLAALRSRADYGTGLSLGAPVAPGTSLTLRVSYSVMDNNNAQRTRSDATITWEARNT